MKPDTHLPTQRVPWVTPVQLAGQVPLATAGGGDWQDPAEDMHKTEQKVALASISNTAVASYEEGRG